MRQPFTQLYVHLLWATWDRLPLITAELERQIYACVTAECRKMRVEVLALNGVEDHVHLVVRFPTTIAIAALVKQVKGSSSHLVTHRLPSGEPFKWQGAYAAYTFARHDLDRIRAYVASQKEHHRDGGLEADLERIFVEVEEE